MNYKQYFLPVCNRQGGKWLIIRARDVLFYVFLGLLAGFGVAGVGRGGTIFVFWG